MQRILAYITFTVLLFGLSACTDQNAEYQGTKTIAQLSTVENSTDVYTLVGEKSFLSGYDPINEDSTINIVVEIPTGTTAKWEVTKPDGVMKWEFKEGNPRVVKYLGYPGNYGMIPQTLLPKELGGDGDPLDVILLGDALPRGSVAKGRLIGVLKLLDEGEQDDKLIAVQKDSPLFAAKSLADLQEKFPGVAEIIETWFSNYDGKGATMSKGFGDFAEAEKILYSAIAAFPSH